MDSILATVYFWQKLRSWHRGFSAQSVVKHIYIYMHQIFIFENSIDNPPYGDIGEKFTNCINLIKPGYHYNLVVSSEKHKTSGAR